MPVAIIILAAGQGTRMQSDLPKVLHPIAGQPMLAHVMQRAASVSPDEMVIVAGHGSDAVTRAAHDVNPDARIVLQAEQRGTGDAAATAQEALAGFDGDAIVLFGDTPFVEPRTFARILEERRAGSDIVVLGFEPENPGPYGRLITDGPELNRIVEAKDATPDELDVPLCNSGIMAADAQLLFTLLAQVEPANAQGEYYLTDIVEIARNAGHSARVVTCPETETLGINSRVDLAAAEAVFQARMREDLLTSGVTMTAPDTVWFAADTHIGRDVSIGPNVLFGPGVTVETGAVIHGFCHLEGCHISSGSSIGPFARLRPGAEIGDDARVGNFVEIKNANVEKGAKINHLSYIGDADIRQGANIGAGTITCNYDGVFKHRTEIGANAFIGSNSALVAPVRIGANALIGSGAVITRNVADGDLALARARQENKTGLGAKLMDRLKALKAAGKKPK